MTTKYELRQRVYEEVYVVHDAFATAGEALHALSETFAPGEHYLVRIEEKVVARRVVGKDNQRFLDRLGEVFLRRTNG